MANAKMRVGEADTLRLMMREKGLDPKEGASEEDLQMLGFERAVDGSTAWHVDGLTVFVNGDGSLEDVGDR